MTVMIADDDTPPGFRLAALVLDRIVAEGLEPHPSNYTLWHTYYSGALPDLTRAIDILEKDGRPFTQAHCDDLFQKYFSADAEAQAIREAGERAQTALDMVLVTLESAGLGTGRYVESLGGFLAELEGPLTLEGLRAIITAITAETRALAEEHDRLRHRLASTGSELSQLRARLHSARREVLIDGLTGIRNRKGFDTALTEAAAAAITEGQPLSLLMIDIDHFKPFNDRHGHLVGDHVLRLVAKVLTECVKGRDTVARFGGAAFAIILPHTTLAEAVVVADHVRVAVGRRQIVNRTRTETFGTITLSVGVTQYVARESLTDLIARADAPLYVAKRTGRNRVCFQGAPSPRTDAE